ncbi:MAG: acyl-CoA dehydrogenase [Acidimicrobiaceae bacterium]|mgnify:CR=1 FL=1|jgi:alkylation response protein AidB-like acyl-CoA dehydrogenase|nr:acyl-CoA dehydrogenase [Acidimicrobiaceae bacterium]|tara:strand:+ start:118747 stop:119865 length:1119 start_codon:yes stop_codon:yes gene_type:complete
MSFDFSFPLGLKNLQARAKLVAEKGVQDFGCFDDSWINGYSKEFSKVLASEGWIGMTWPIKHGGGGRPGIERIVVAEEMMKVGAPISASWIADRQMGPAIYSYGTNDQQQRFLPEMLQGESTWCIGMSEPNSGSDLASLQTFAKKEGDIYIVNGQKIWTSIAAISDYCYLIVRTSNEGPPHKGLSELVVPMDLEGIEVRPIVDAVGNSHFCEIFFTDVKVSADNLIGQENNAFSQTMSQLEHERGGIDRLMSNWLLFERACEVADKEDPIVRQEIAALETGYRIGRVLVYKGALGQAPAGFSAGTKCFCTEHEQRVANFASKILGLSSIAGNQLQMGIAYAPAYTIQGGTSDVMRNILGERVLGLPREPRVK